jgi:aryl-alcohol dehydrogenase-like predicted oxidoreductase
VTNISATDLDVFPLCLGGNVFGWTADEKQSFAVLDAYAAAGGNFVDTADTYSAFVPGNAGGESETIIGKWLATRGNRDAMVIATKVGSWERQPGLSAQNIRSAAEGSLRRLQTDHIDLYYAHRDDANTPLEETLGAFDELVRSGKVRYIAASNYTAPRLAEALAVSDRENLARYVGIQQHYNLVEREYEGELGQLVAKEGMSSMPYFGLAKGFLTGKYRPGGPDIDSPRAKGAAAYLDDRGLAVLAVLDEIAAAHQTTVAAVALGWLATQPTVVSAIASARTTEQLAELLPMAELKLTVEEIDRLNSAA